LFESRETFDFIVRGATLPDGRKDIDIAGARGRRARVRRRKLTEMSFPRCLAQGNRGVVSGMVIVLDAEINEERRLNGCGIVGGGWIFCAFT
jgi:hypothetical protein